MKKVISGFTLIELLIVVLIAGILTAIAVPQYQKAVTRSRNATLKAYVTAIGQAEKLYFMEHGKYAANFRDLDVKLSGFREPTTSGTEEKYFNSSNPCALATMGDNAIIYADNFLLMLNTTNVTKGMSVRGLYWKDKWTQIKWQCAGMTYYLPDDTLYCWEGGNANNGYKQGAGDFCEKIERGTYTGKGSRLYSLP